MAVRREFDILVIYMSDRLGRIADIQSFTLYATWTINRYTVSFATDGGSSVTAITKDYGSEIIVTDLPDPEKDGSDFGCWCSDSALTGFYSGIGYSAFYGCTALETVTFVDGSAFSKYRLFRFPHLPILRSVIIPARAGKGVAYP